ncbi:MAG: glycosyltransferase family 1 protein [Candidatus Moraniibacteriota bacterium]
MPIRIAVDIRCLTDGKHTGVEEYTRHLLEQLLVIDTTNQYILFYTAWRRPQPDFSWLAAYPNVTLRWFRVPNKLLNLSLWYLQWPRLDTLLGGVDIFFLPNLNFAAFSRKVKVVLTVHDLSFDRFPETFGWKQRFWHTLVNFRGLARRADVIVAVSDTTRKEYLAHKHTHHSHTFAIPNGIDERFRIIDRNEPQLLAVKEKYHLPFSFILFFGTIEPRKNIQALVEAYEYLVEHGGAECAKYSLVLAGSPGWCSKGILERINRSPVREKIILLGFVDDADCPALYNLASLFVYPSLYEGFGFPPLEAMACGVPVIVSQTSVFPETVGDAGILIDPQNPEEIYQAMREVLGDAALRAHLRSKGLERVQHFSWKQSAQTLHKLWRKITK